MPKLLIRNVRLARPDGSIIEGDLLCHDGTIERIAVQISVPADETLDTGEKIRDGVRGRPLSFT